MPILPSFYASKDGGHAWSVARWAAGGAAIGALAGLFKALAPLEGRAPGASAAERIAAHAVEIVVAAVIFAVLCAAIAALRNLIARRLIWPKMR